jgi:predicted transposase/invertase (TIGR01784 family)
VVDIEYQSPEVWPSIKPLRNSIADVRCFDNQKRQFLVEMQMEWTTDFTTRILFNASKAYISQFEVKVNLKDIETVYSLNFINRVFDHDPAAAETYYHHYALFEKENPKNKIEGLEFVLVELPKFKPGVTSSNPKRDAWLRFLTEIKNNTDEIPGDLASEETLKTAFVCLERAAYSKEQLLGYDEYWDGVRYISALSDGKFREGMELGKKMAKEMGMELGMKLGMEKTNREHALKMLEAGIPMETITHITGITSLESE